MKKKLKKSNLFITDPVDPNNTFLILENGTVLHYKGRIPYHSSLKREKNDNDFPVAYHCDEEGILFWVAIPPHSDSTEAYEFELYDTYRNRSNAKKLLKDKACHK